jgi:uncharacterized membrane protein
MKKLLITAFFFIVNISMSFAQCAMCRATVDSNLSEGRGVIGTGLNFGIMYLFMMPYLLIGILIFMYFRVGKKELNKRLQLQQRIKNIYN